jgi:hypothetical protein
MLFTQIVLSVNYNILCTDDMAGIVWRWLRGIWTSVQQPVVKDKFSYAIVILIHRYER